MSIDLLIESFVVSFLNEDKRNALLRMGYTKELANFIHSEFQPYSNKYGDWIGKQFITPEVFSTTSNIKTMLITLKEETVEDRPAVEAFVNKWVSKEILKHKNEIVEVLEWATKRSGGLKVESYSFSDLQKMMFRFKEQEEHSKVKKSFEDGWKWVDLQGSNCDSEAKEMGHCGNDDRGDLWSLRDPNAKSHITLTMTDNNTIVQMKGAGNSKPNKKYFKYIAALLAEPSLVKGIRQHKHYGSDIDPNDFAFDDLGDNGMKWVLERNPELYYDGKPIDLEKGLDQIIAYIEKVILKTFNQDNDWMNATRGIKEFSFEKVETEEFNKITLEGNLVFNRNFNQEEMLEGEGYVDFINKRNFIKREIEDTFQHIKVDILNKWPDDQFLNYIPFYITIKPIGS